MDTLDHGNPSTYFNHKCRCEPCKKAASEYRKAQKARGLPEGDKRHGTTNGYFGWGCRCDLCKAAMSEYVRTPERRSSQRTRHLKATYGLTPEEWEVKWQSQNRACASCGVTPREDERRFHVDHNHDTGEVRGILCQGCNVALGSLGEDPERIRALAAYIESYQPF